MGLYFFRATRFGCKTEIKTAKIEFKERFLLPVLNGICEGGDSCFFFNSFFEWFVTIVVGFYVGAVGVLGFDDFFSLSKRGWVSLIL